MYSFFHSFSFFLSFYLSFLWFFPLSFFLSVGKFSFIFLFIHYYFFPSSPFTNLILVFCSFPSPLFLTLSFILLYRVSSIHAHSFQKFWDLSIPFSFSYPLISSSLLLPLYPNPVTLPYSCPYYLPTFYYFFLFLPLTLSPNFPIHLSFPLFYSSLSLPSVPYHLINSLPPRSYLPPPPYSDLP